MTQKEVQKLTDEALAENINRSHKANKAAKEAVKEFQGANKEGDITADNMRTYRDLLVALETSQLEVNFFAGEMHRRQDAVVKAAIAASPFKVKD